MSRKRSKKKFSGTLKFQKTGPITHPEGEEGPKKYFQTALKFL
jgi:hypothetical protein